MQKEGGIKLNQYMLQFCTSLVRKRFRTGKEVRRKMYQER